MQRGHRRDAAGHPRDDGDGGSANDANDGDSGGKGGGPCERESGFWPRATD